MNMDYSYDEYKCHLVVGLLYKQAHVENGGKAVYSIDELSMIKSVIENFIFLFSRSGKLRLTGRVVAIRETSAGQTALIY